MGSKPQEQVLISPAGAMKGRTELQKLVERRLAQHKRGLSFLETPNAKAFLVGGGNRAAVAQEVERVTH